jgi:hypothetical protein
MNWNDLRTALLALGPLMAIFTLLLFFMWGATPACESNAGGRSGSWRQIDVGQLPAPEKPIVFMTPP